jgi:2-oxoglutarate dehydrogenase E1 component
MKELWGSSHISAGHAAYLESLYETFINNPENLSKEWLDFFTIFQVIQILMEKYLIKK